MLEAVVLKTASNSLLTLMVLASYLWGGCLSCEKFFMAPANARHCCEAGKCKTSPAPRAQSDCKRLALELTPDPHSLVAAAVAFSVVTPLAAPVLVPDPWVETAYLSVKSPPDLPILHASLLI